MDNICSCCLTIAGSDSGGNAGIQADLRTFNSHKVHGCVVLTALTAQNPNGVFAVHPLPADFIAAQLDAVLGTYSIAALKTGMLATAHAVKTAVEKLREFPKIAKVIDPVMVATSGSRLIDDKALAAVKNELLPIATVITPNIPEAETLCNRELRCIDDIKDAAKCIGEHYGCAVMIKGGHGLSHLPFAEDVLWAEGKLMSYTSPWIANPISTHGTGCTLSAAIASQLALGCDIFAAVGNAKQYVYSAIKNSYLVGKDCGVLGQ
jgi:hydroxymethylpyrimidine/phosphomethylpyrimidine kinase